jgi:hypothetical protein
MRVASDRKGRVSVLVIVLVSVAAAVAMVVLGMVGLIAFSVVAAQRHVKVVRVRPYYNHDPRSNVSRWYGETSFQIICAGSDGQYGGILEDGTGPVHSDIAVAPHFPSADNFVGRGHLDNQTNFTRSGTLQDLRE